MNMDAGRSFFEIVEAENLGWEAEQGKRARRLAELAARDRPTLRNSFTDEFELTRKYKNTTPTRASNMRDFFAMAASSKTVGRPEGSVDRMVIMLRVMQAVVARAVDLYMARTIVGNLRNQLDRSIPSLNNIFNEASPNKKPSDILHYVTAQARIDGMDELRSEMGASLDDSGNTRIHWPMAWLETAIAKVFYNTSTAAGFFVTDGVLRHINNRLRRSYYDDQTVREAFNRVLPGIKPGYGTSTKLLQQALFVLGMAGDDRLPYRDLVRIGGDDLRKNADDLPKILSWCKENSRKKTLWGNKTLASTPFNKRPAILDTMFDAFDSAELFISIMPRSVQEASEGKSIGQMEGSWSISSRLAACIRVPKPLASHIGQSLEPRLDAIAEWASNGMDYLTKAPHSFLPDPMPDTAKQARKLEPIIKQVPSISEDGICTNLSGEPIYIPDTELSEYERFAAEIKDINEVTVQGTEMYDPGLVERLGVLPSTPVVSQFERYEQMPVEMRNMVDRLAEKTHAAVGVENMGAVKKDMPANTVLYTNWNLGTVTWTTPDGNINLSDVSRWRPLKVANLMRFINRRGLDQLGIGGLQFQNSLEYMCEHFDISTRIVDYVRPEDLSVFFSYEPRAALAPTGEGSSPNLPAAIPDPGPDGLEENISEMYGGSVSNLFNVVTRVEKFVNKLIRILTNLEDEAKAWEDPTDDRYDARMLLPALNQLMAGQDASMGRYGTWSAMYELEIPGSPKSVPSPLRFIKRIIDAIHAASGGSYRSMMGGTMPFFGTRQAGVAGISHHIAMVEALAKYTSFRRIMEGSEESLSKYRNQDDLDPDAGIEPMMNVSKDAYLLQHQGVNDQRMVKDPDRQIMAVAAGGGKTIMGSMQRGSRALAQNKRVLIVCPNNLIPNYVEDVALLSGGKINVFPITLEVYQSYRKGQGVDKLYKSIVESPPNTIFVLGMNSLRSGEMKSLYFQGRRVQRSDVLELTRHVDWWIVMVDESHRIRNPTSIQYQSLANLFRGVPKLVQMTGTYITDTVMDVWKQANLLEPGFFGTMADFQRSYYASRGLPKTDAGPDAMNRLKEMADLMQIRRVEWAAFLPDRIDEFEQCDDLTAAQLAAYESIFDSAIGPADTENDDDTEDDLDGTGGSREQADNILGYSLSKLERFLSAMGTMNPRLPKALRLKREDRVSPKITKLLEVLERHFADPENGKVIVFTQWRDAAMEIAARLKKVYGDRVMHYLAEKQSEQVPLIKSPKSGVDIIVGVQKSIQEGHNFQVANRMVFCETPWSPGDIEQAEARVFRPDLKEDAPKHKRVYYTVLLINNTVDMTKAARLVSKRLVAARGNNLGNPEYRDIDKNFGVIRMGPRTLRAVRRWEDVPPAPVLTKEEEAGGVETVQYFSLAEYLSYVGIDAPGRRPIRNNLNAIDKREMDRIRESGVPQLMPVPDGGIIPGSQISANIPYMDNMRLPFENDLGLKNIAQWASEEHAVSSKEMDPEWLIDYPVHTEYGDGVVEKYNSGGETTEASIRVLLADGVTKVTINPLSKAFFIMDPDKLGGKSTRSKLAELSGLRLAAGGPRTLRISVEPLLQGEDVDDDPEEDIEDEDDNFLDEDDDPELAPDANAPHGYWRDADGELFVKYKLKAEVASVNGQFALLVYTQPDKAPNFEDEGDNTTDIGSYLFVDVTSRRRFRAAYKMLDDGDIKLTKDSKTMLDSLWDKFERDPTGRRMVWNFQAATNAVTRQFHLDNTRRRGASVAVYPVVWRDMDENGKLRNGVFLMAHENQRDARKLLRLRPQDGVKWERDPTGFRIYFYKTEEDALNDLDDIESSDNIEVMNYDEVVDALEGLRIQLSG